jgi:hypothetical protein
MLIRGMVQLHPSIVGVLSAQMGTYDSFQTKLQVKQITLKEQEAAIKML